MSTPFGQTYSARHREPSETPPVLDELRELGTLQSWTISAREPDRLVFTCAAHVGCLVLIDIRSARADHFEDLLADLFADTCWEWRIDGALRDAVRTGGRH